MRNLEDSTSTLLRDYLIRDGRIVSWVTPPDYVNGLPTEDVREMRESFGDRWLDSGPGNGFDKIRQMSPPAIVFSGLPAGNKLFHQRREFDGGRIVFLVNSDPAVEIAGTMTLEGGSAEAWDPFTGAVKPYPFGRRGGKLDLSFSLPPGGSLLLCLKDERAKPFAAPPAPVWQEVAPEGGLDVRPLAPNVLTLDYCDLVLRGRTEKDLYFYDAQTEDLRGPRPAAQSLGQRGPVQDQHPGPGQVPGRFGLRGGLRVPRRSRATPAISPTSRPSSSGPPSSASSSTERKWSPWPGSGGSTGPSASSRSAPTSSPGRTGSRSGPSRSPSTASSSPSTSWGTSAWPAAARGFEIHPPAPLAAGPWKAQGWPFYGAGVRYTRTFVVPEEGADAAYRLELGSWLGATAEVFVGETRVGTAAFPPYQADLTSALKPGPNEVSVVVYGTLRNTLGPFHNDPPLGRAWPGSFQQGAKGGPPPGSGYSSVGYGLFDDFKLVKGGASR